MNELLEYLKIDWRENRPNVFTRGRSDRRYMTITIDPSSGLAKRGVYRNNGNIIIPESEFIAAHAILEIAKAFENHNL